MTLISRAEKHTPPKGIKAKFYRVDPSVKWHDMIAVVSFHGKMPDGSRGKAHGRYISAETMYWMTLLGALSVVLDFRDLDYKWGDSMLGVFQVLEDSFREQWSDIDRSVPIKLLSSDKSSGLYSLVTNQDVYFETVDAAVESCNQDMQFWIDN